MSRGAWGAIGAVVVIVVVLLALLLSGVIPGFSLSSSGGGGGSSGKSYNVTFSESGLPAGTSWSVTLGGSTLSSTTHAIVFSEKNGTYAFTVGAVSGFAPSPATGSVTVSGAATSKAIAFTTAYSVTFTESGLTAGTSWSVTLGGSLKSSSTTTIVFSEQNGTYAFTVGSVAAYTANPTSGNLTVSGAAASQTITFTATPGVYSVTFTESGLPGGTMWSVTLNGGTPSTSTTTTISYSEMNGSYPFTIGAVTGYTASPSSGSVTVSGAAASQGITFTSSGGGGGGPQLYSQAKPVADGVVSGHSSSAVIVGAIAFDSRNPYTNSTSNTTKANCTLSGGSTTTLTLPTYSGNYHAGESPAWIFLYFQASPVAILAVVVLNGQGTYVGEETGSGCVSSTYQNETFPSNPIDSSTAGAAAAGTTNGSAFVAAHSSADADYFLIGGYTEHFGIYNYTYPASWNVIFSTCSAGYTGSGSDYEAQINATSGAVITDYATANITCSGNPVLIVSGGGQIGPAQSVAGVQIVLATAPRE